MDWFEYIKTFYADGDWTKEQVAAAVVMKKITAGTIRRNHRRAIRRSVGFLFCP
nr:XkdX family protein [Bacillus pumilus]